MAGAVEPVLQQRDGAALDATAACAVTKFEGREVKSFSVFRGCGDDDGGAPLLRLTGQAVAAVAVRILDEDIQFLDAEALLP